MKIVREDYSETIKNIASFCKYTKEDIDNIEFLTNYNDKDRMNDLFKYVESNYDSFHKDDVNNKSYYMLKAASIMKNYEHLVNNISNNCLSLIVTEFPFDLDNDNNIERFKVIASDELLAEVRILSNRFKPVDTICSLLQHYDENKYKITDEQSLQRFREFEIKYLMEDSKHYYLTHLSSDEYIKKVKEEELLKNGLK